MLKKCNSNKKWNRNYSWNKDYSWMKNAFDKLVMTCDDIMNLSRTVSINSINKTDYF